LNYARKDGVFAYSQLSRARLHSLGFTEAKAIRGASSSELLCRRRCGYGRHWSGGPWRRRLEGTFLIRRWIRNEEQNRSTSAKDMLNERRTLSGLGPEGFGDLPQPQPD
jgi:hypothetical protein